MNESLAIVLSSENTRYLAWQTALFCASCIRNCRTTPLVIVHSTSEPLRPEFSLIQDWGCTVQIAPSYRTHPLGNYPPRNEPGSLLEFANLLRSSQRRASIPDGARFALFCETDMLLLKPPSYPAALCGQYYDYLDYRDSRLTSLLRAYDLLRRADHLNCYYSVGVPYLIPFEMAGPIATRWLEVLDRSTDLTWIDIMYAFGIAAASLGVQPHTVADMDVNYDNLKPVTARILHYCYGDNLWNKRQFIDTSPLDYDPCADWLAADNTILGSIVTEIQEARRLFSTPPPSYG